jgi:hypothetical protein
MFRIPRLNVIESDEGFSVEVLGRTGLLYVEGNRSLHIDSEVLAGPSALALFKHSIRNWDSPFDGETIDEDKIKMIVENIRQAFRFRGIEIEII